MQTMRNSDLLARMGGALMAGSALWNVLVAATWVMSLLWFVVGLLWLVPLALAVLQLMVAGVTVVGGHNRLAVFGPLVGMFVSLCNLNFLAVMLELLNLGLMLGASVARAAEEREHAW